MIYLRECDACKNYQRMKTKNCGMRVSFTHLHLLMNTEHIIKFKGCKTITLTSPIQLAWRKIISPKHLNDCTGLDISSAPKNKSLYRPLSF